MQAARRSAGAAADPGALSPLAALDRAAPLYIADLSGRILYANDEYRRLVAEAYGEGKLHAVPEGDALAEAIASIVATGETVRREIALPGSPPRHVRSRLDGVYAADGTPTGVVAVIEALGEETALRQRLALAQERLDDITRLVSDWIWETDAQLALVSVSPRVVELLGFHARELVGRPFLELGEFLDEAGHPAASPLDLQRLAPFRDRLVRMRHNDGSARLFRVSSLPVFDTRTGDFVGFRGTARDVTGEVEASERAQRSQRQLVEAIESISEGFALFDADDRLLLCNAKFRAMFPNTALPPGISFLELSSGALESGDVRVPEREREAWLERRLAARREQRAALEMQLGDGRWMKVSDRRTADGLTVGIRTDITEMKRREEALLAAKETAEIASRSKSEFLANISHELRTPLNAIIGFSEIMRDEIFGPIGNPQYRAYLDDVLESAQHLLQVINDILDVAKAEAGKLDLAEDEVDLGALARGALRLVEERAQRAELTLRLAVPEDAPRLRADERKLKQVLLNLLANAVKFTPSGGSIEVGARLDVNGDLLVTVADTGIGIAEADIAVALAPFGQVDGRLNRKYEGTGLGLPLSRALVELHGGRLAIDSTVGVGTTVTVRLPAARVVAHAD
jgi:PAS domain S-box-containing protein